VGQLTGGLGGQDHLPCGAVFDRAAGVVTLQLGENPYFALVMRVSSTNGVLPIASRTVMRETPADGSGPDKRHSMPRSRGVKAAPPTARSPAVRR